MKTIKIIDILCYISIGEKDKIPKKIKWRDSIWEYDDRNQDYTNGHLMLFEQLKIIKTKEFLNDEVEVIDDEKWKTIEDFPNYEISTKGNVRTKKYCDSRKHLRKSKILNKKINNVGYEYVILSNKEIKHKTLTVHRLMAKTFLNDYYNTLEVNHINGIKTDNRLENLEMVTHSENMKKRYEIGIDGNNYKAVNQYDLDGNYIATYKSSCEAEKITNICRTSIGSCCRKEEGHLTAGGYIWKFKDEEDEFEDIESFGIHYSWDYIDYKNIEELKKYVNKDFQNIFDTLDKLIKNQKKIIERLKDGE